VRWTYRRPAVARILDAVGAMINARAARGADFTGN